MKLDASLPKYQRLTRSSDIQGVLDKGHKYRGSFFTLFLTERVENCCRVGFLVPKKLGNAVLRNRVKRLGREAFRRQKSLFDPGLDLVFLARTDVKEWNYQQVYKEMADLVRKLRRVIPADPGSSPE